MEIVEIIALSMGVAWASGINLYAAVLVLGFMGGNGYFTLPEELVILTDPLVMIAAGFMYMVEFVADKTPGVDSGWDAIHTFIRIPAGAVLAAGAVGDVNVAAEFSAFLVGGGLAAGSHFTKAGSRVLINTSPEPFSNWAASIGEDLLVIGGLWVALSNPLLFLVMLIIFIGLVIWLMPKIWRSIKQVYFKIRGWFKAEDKTEENSRLDRDDHQ